MSEKLPSFSQAQGLEPLPEILKIGELSDEVRNRIWSAIYRFLRDGRQTGPSGYYIPQSSTAITILEDVYLSFLDIPVDSLPKYSDIEKQIKTIILRGPYNKVFDFVLEFLRHSSCPQNFISAIESSINDSNIAYKLILDPPPQ